jgi:predicted acetyltransferase
MTVPGGAAVPTSGIAYVTVNPAHRRRGILTSMMDVQLREAEDRGDTFAGLWASESLIYGRFGFGVAIQSEKWSIPRTHAGISQAPDNGLRLRECSADEARPYLSALHEQVRPTRPGMFRRPSNWWDFDLADPEHTREGSSEYHHVVCFDSGSAEPPIGYVTYRLKGGEHTVEIEELVAATDDAHTKLWEYCLSIDLQKSITSWNQPLDDPLPWKLKDSRRLGRIVVDGLWLRLLDIPAAMSARRYEHEGRVVIGVNDLFRPSNDGAYELDGGPDGARCRVATGEADVTMNVSDLAAMYFGDVRASTLLQAGRIDESRSGAVDTLDRMISWPIAPWCPQDF